MNKKNKENKEFTCYNSSINILFNSATREQLMDRIIYLEKHIEKVVRYLDEEAAKNNKTYII